MSGVATTASGNAGHPSFLEDLGCPVCRETLFHYDQKLVCPRCGRIFPILFGIPDLRLQGDRYLSLEAERAKAAHLAKLAEAGASFEELVDRYYRMTDDVPHSLATRFKAYIRSGQSRGDLALKGLTLDPARTRLLDLGTGTGGLLVAAAGRCREVVGADVALRWLVIAKRRLEEVGVTAGLVCTDLKTPVFRRPFDVVVAMDVLEHVHDLDQAFAGIVDCLEPAGQVWLSAANSRFLGPHPAVGLWGAGWWPQSWRSRWLRHRHGVDLLRETLLIDTAAVGRTACRHGLLPCSIRSRTPLGDSEAGRSRIERGLIAIYRTMIRSRHVDQFLAYHGPAFEMICRYVPSG